MPKYKKKPVIIEAVQWNEPDVWPEKYPAMDRRPEFKKSVTLVDKGIAIVHTIHNNQSVKLENGDWIIPEPDGEHYYPCKPDIFEKTYEAV